MLIEKLVRFSSANCSIWDAVRRSDGDAFLAPICGINVDDSKHMERYGCDGTFSETALRSFRHARDIIPERQVHLESRLVLLGFLQDSPRTSSAMPINASSCSSVRMQNDTCEYSEHVTMLMVDMKSDGHDKSATFIDGQNLSRYCVTPDNTMDNCTWIKVYFNYRTTFRFFLTEIYSILQSNLLHGIICIVIYRVFAHIQTSRECDIYCWDTFHGRCFPK